jgi:hypothetical protein
MAVNQRLLRPRATIGPAASQLVPPTYVAPLVTQHGEPLEALCNPPSSETLRLIQKTMRKLRGRYIATHVRWGKTLDLHDQNRVDLMGTNPHGRENQQARASFPSLFSLGADRYLTLTPCLQLQIAAHDRSGSSFPAVQVSPSTMS